MKAIPESKRWKQTGKGLPHSFLALPHHLLASDAFGALSGYAVKAIIEAARQYKGTNNGDLSLPWSRMHRRGWRSKSTLWAAIREAIEAGFLKQSRQGGRNHICALYAITWKPIDECAGKLDIPATSTASNDWQKQNERSLCGTQEFAMRTLDPEIAEKAA